MARALSLCIFMNMNMHKCKYCEKEFDTKQKLGGHIIHCKMNPTRNGKSGFSKYNEELRKAERIRPEYVRKCVICEVCGKSYSQKGIGSHMWRAHGAGKDLPASGKGHPAWNKGKTKSNDERLAKSAELISRTMKGRPSNQVWTEEMREKQSTRKKEYFEKNPDKHPNRLVANNKKKWTYPEKVAADWFESLGIDYIKNKKINRFFPDFVVDNIIVEIDGQYWHDKDSDEKRDRILESEGYVVYRIAAKENIHKRLEEIFGTKSQ